jgi:hypothetical protein
MSSGAKSRLLSREEGPRRSPTRLLSCAVLEEESVGPAVVKSIAGCIEIAKGVLLSLRAVSTLLPLGG